MISGYEPFAKVFEYNTLRQVLSAPPRDNAEGFVVFCGNDIVKYKQEDYVALHRLVTGLNEKTVWEAMLNGTLEELRSKMPEEFTAWVDDVSAVIKREARQTINAATAAFQTIITGMSADDGRKEFASAAVEYKGLTSYLFAMYDGRDIRPMVLKNCKPKTSSSLVSEEEG